MNSKIFKQTLFIFFPSSLVLILMIVANKVFNINYAWMTRDLSVLGNLNPFSGFLSSLGILLWGVTSSICLFSSALFKTQKKIFLFLLSSGILTLYLLIDDLFLIHEQLNSVIFGGEKTIFFILGVLVLFHFIIFRSIFCKSKYILLLISLVFFSISIIVDLRLFDISSSSDISYFLEDGAKWLGIVFWCSYYVETSFIFVSARSGSL